MNHQLKINLSLVIIMIVLLIILFNDTPEKEIKQISTINLAQIHTITIQYKDRPRLAFKRNQDWFMTEPYSIKAHQPIISRILEIADSPSQKKLSADSVSLSNLQLDPPIISLSLNDYKFSFGSIDKIDRLRYVLFENNIYLIADALINPLLSSAPTLIDRQLLPPKFTLKTMIFPNFSYHKQDAHWITEPQQDLSNDISNKLAAHWQQATALIISEYQPNKEHEKNHSISMTNTDGETITFKILQQNPTLTLFREDMGLQYHLSSNMAENLLPHTETPN